VLCTKLGGSHYACAMLVIECQVPPDDYLPKGTRWHPVAECIDDDAAEKSLNERQRNARNSGVRLNYRLVKK
jgi:hypothetical protein